MSDPAAPLPPPELPTKVAPADYYRFRLASTERLVAEHAYRLAQIEALASGGGDQRPLRTAEAELRQAQAKQQAEADRLFAAYQCKEGDDVLPDFTIVRKG